MKITFLTIFPSSFESFLSYPVIRRAVKNGLVEFEVVDIREYTEGSYRAIDDSPYGGGRGLLLKVDTMMKALSAVRTPSSHVVLMGPKGTKFNQQKAHEYSKMDHLVLVAGHFEGVDERFRSYIDEEVSIGDYILTGGESAAAIVAEAVTRLLEGALREDSATDESFEDDLLEYPQYTHPETYEGMKVPEVLLRGNKDEIAVYHEKKALHDTMRLRPDLLPENKDYKYFSLHKDYGDEEKILSWIGSRLPTPKIIDKTENYLVLSKLKGKPLSEGNRNRILRVSASVLKRLWSLDTADCPVHKDIKSTLQIIRNGKLSIEEWKELEALEKEEIEEDQVFTHGNLTLDSILANGSGLTGILNFQNAGIADKYRDLSTLLDSLESIGIKKSEILELLGMKLDEKKLAFYRRLNRLG